MADEPRAEIRGKKKHRKTDRPLTVGLFLLRCIELGLRLGDLEELEVGMVNDMYIEKSNDNEKYSQLAEQSDFDKF
jgi:hypothetical protein